MAVQPCVWSSQAVSFCLTCVVLFLQDLKANESRLRDINKVASELESEGLMAEEAPMVQAQVSTTAVDLLLAHIYAPYLAVI